MSNHSYTYDRDECSSARIPQHNNDAGVTGNFITAANLVQATDSAESKDIHTSLFTITTGINTGQSPLQFMHGIDTARAHMGNRAFMHYVYQQYYQQAHDIAQDGFRDVPQAFPFQEQIQQVFGEYHDIGDLKAYTGTAAQAANAKLGSRAFHKEGHVAFAGQPTLKEAAHEAAHYVQNVRSDQLEGGIGETNDRYEQHADRVADKVVRGQSAAPLLEHIPRSSDGSAPITSSVEAPVQMMGGNLLRRLAGLGLPPRKLGPQTLLQRYYHKLLAGNRALIVSAESPDPVQPEIFRQRTELRQCFKNLDSMVEYPENLEEAMRIFLERYGKDVENGTIASKYRELNAMAHTRNDETYGSFKLFEKDIKAAHPGAWSYKDLFQDDRATKAGFPDETIRSRPNPLMGGYIQILWPLLYGHAIDAMRDAIRKNPSAEYVHVNFDSLRTNRIAELIKVGNVSRYDEMTQWDMSQQYGVTEWELVRALETLGSSRVHTYSYDNKKAKYNEIDIGLPDQIPEVGTPEHERLVEHFRKLKISYAGPR